MQAESVCLKSVQLLFGQKTHQRLLSVLLSSLLSLEVKYSSPSEDTDLSFSNYCTLLKQPCSHTPVTFSLWDHQHVVGS